MSTNNRARSSSIVLLIVSLAMTWLTAPAHAEPLAIGAIAPDFSLTQTDGRTFNLSDYRGKKSVYLVFWNTWCGPCMKKTPKLIAIENQLGKQVELLAINTGWSDSLPQVKTFQSRFSTNYAIAFDHAARVTELFGVWGTPTEFIVDINGIIRRVDDVPPVLAANIERWNQLETTASKSANSGKLANKSCAGERLC